MQLRPIRVILIEDNPAEILLMKEAITALSQEVHLQVFSDGLAAKDAISSIAAGSLVAPIDFIILDLNIPEIAGLELLHTLKHQSSTRQIPVLVFSDSNSPSDILSAYQNGANSYLPKPVDLEGFFSLVERVFFFWSEVVTLPNR